MDGAKRGFSLIDWLVLLVVVGGLMVFLGPVVMRSIYCPQKVTACANNLSQLWKMEHIYASRYGKMPTETGRAFWLKLREVKLVEVDDIFNCPTRGEPSRDCQYRGPGVSVGKLKDDGIVGADDLQNHGDEGGNVLRKSGDVMEIPDPHGFETLTSGMK